MNQIVFVTVHPRFIASYLDFGVLGAAIRKDRLVIDVLDLRDFAVDDRGSVDDVPFGGGEGMVMRPEPLAAAVKHISGRKVVIHPSPTGSPWHHQQACHFAQMLDTDNGNPKASEVSPPPLALVFVCGRFAGLDQRFIDRYVDHEFSCGDYVVAGGELPALIMADAVARQIPGILGSDNSAVQDSFAAGMAGGLEHPLYTRPACFEGVSVPPVLRSGDHKQIERWRWDQSRERTRTRRPDLMADHPSPTTQRQGSPQNEVLWGGRSTRLEIRTRD